MAQPGHGEGLLILWSYDLGSSNLPPRVILPILEEKKRVFCKMFSSLQFTSKLCLKIKVQVKIL